jgi:hypothetical protein
MPAIYSVRRGIQERAGRTGSRGAASSDESFEQAVQPVLVGPPTWWRTDWFDDYPPAAPPSGAGNAPNLSPLYAKCWCGLTRRGLG